uniref:Saposin B-type domain-containing protein n=1 Tax=Strongyloides venezuelensis TaxID=75913 RepID=A0A0K0FNE0_STRVS
MRNFLFVILCSFILLISLTTIRGEECGDATQSCKCCKLDCWHSKAEQATDELGHIPGENNEEEALNTLKLIKKCVTEKCTQLCKVHFRRRPFFNVMQ